MINTATAKQIVNDILFDLQDRSGLQNAWEEIDEDTQREIEQKWIKLVLEVANG